MSEVSDLSYGWKFSISYSLESPTKVYTLVDNSISYNTSGGFTMHFFWQYHIQNSRYTLAARQFVAISSQSHRKVCGMWDVSGVFCTDTSVILSFWVSILDVALGTPSQWMSAWQVSISGLIANVSNSVMSLFWSDISHQRSVPPACLDCGWHVDSWCHHLPSASLPGLYQLAWSMTWVTRCFHYLWTYKQDLDPTLSSPWVPYSLNILMIFNPLQVSHTMWSLSLHSILIVTKL